MPHSKKTKHVEEREDISSATAAARTFFSRGVFTGFFPDFIYLCDGGQGKKAK
jgi:hypothetical protein